jgi:hypothetical protein
MEFQMYAIRGKTKKGMSVTGQFDGASASAAVAAAEAAVKKSGDEIVQISAKSVEGSAGIKVAAPRKRKAK